MKRRKLIGQFKLDNPKEKTVQDIINAFEEIAKHESGE